MYLSQLFHGTGYVGFDTPWSRSYVQYLQTTDSLHHICFNSKISPISEFSKNVRSFEGVLMGYFTQISRLFFQKCP